MKSILILDESEPKARGLRQVLEQAGFQIREASAGEAAELLEAPSSVLFLAGAGATGATHDAQGLPPRIAGSGEDITERQRTEHALRGSEDRHRQIIEALPAAVYTCDAEGRITFFNETAVKMWGRTPDLDQERWCGSWRIYEPDGRPLPRDECPMAIAIREGRPVDGREVIVECPDGSRYSVLPRPAPIFDASGAVIGGVNMVVDLTERRQAEERLRKVVAQLADAQRLAHIGSWEWDIATDTVTWSDEKYRLMGFEPQEVPVTYATFLGCVHPEDRDRIHETVLKAQSDGLAFSYEYRAIRPDGRVRLLYVEATVGTDVRGRALRMIGTTQDITERKAAEDALRESDTRFRQLAENISTVFWLADPGAARIHYVSPAYEKIWRRSCASLYAEPRSWLDSIHSDDRAAVLGKMVDFPERTEFDATYRILWPDGSIRWIHDRGFPVRDAQGRLQRIAGLAEDITERMRTEQQLAEFAELREVLASRLITVQEDERRHLARELHDQIGQGLTAVKISLQGACQSGKQAVCTERLEGCIQLLDELTERVRELSLALRPPPLDDLGLVSALRSYLDRQALAGGFHLEFFADPALGRFSAEIEIACFRVVQEAVTNILRHAEADRVTVELRRSPEALHLSVQDNGIGFDPAASREDPAGREGLGLLGMRERVKLLGGEIDCRTGPGEGVEIHAFFPLAAAVAPAT